jgi:beta-fructofuranosidase
MAKEVYQFKTGNNTRLDMVIHRMKKPGRFALTQGSKPPVSKYLNFDSIELHSIQIAPQASGQLEIENIQIELIYLWNEKEVLDKGVEFLHHDSSGELKNIIAAKAYLQTFRNQFHFAPFKNWMNDPNGVCFFKGHYHVFYQYNPASQIWGNMFWGHAVSGDLLHWHHLPICFTPQVELQGLSGFRGGAFSGSAIVEKGCMNLYFTRHFGTNDRQWAREWQVSSVTKNGIYFSPEKKELINTPPGVTHDFRDPKVFTYNQSRYMVLGGRQENNAVVMLYKRTDMQEWEYQGILLKENNPHYAIAECPDFYFLDGNWVLTAGYISGEEISDRSLAIKRDVCYYLGSFNGKKFVPVKKGLLDFGRDYYAVQSFVHRRRRISMAWNNDNLRIHHPEKNGSNGTLAIPREMRVYNGRLLAKPIAEMKALETGQLFKNSMKHFSLVIKTSNTWKLDLAFAGLNQFEAVLASGSEGSLSLRYKDGLFIMRCGEQNTGSCEVKKLNNVTAYIDRSLLEVFLNDGEYAGAMRYYMTKRKDCVELSAETDVITSEGIGLKSIWSEGL